MSANWLRWAFAAAMIGVAIYHVARLATSRAQHRPDSADAELTHAAMGVAMTMMLLGVLAPSESRRVGLFFTVALIWFIGRGVLGYIMEGPRAAGPPIRHVAGCAAMIYMLVVVSGPASAASAMPGMAMAPTSGSSPIATAALLAATVAVALWTVARPRAVGLPATPALAAGCQLAMTAATAYMLIAM